MTRNDDDDSLLILSRNAIDKLIRAMRPSSLAGYWSAGELTGTTAFDTSQTGANGAYTGSGGTPYALNQVGIGDGSPSTLFDGLSGRIDLTTNLALANTAMGDKSKGTILAWGKVSAAGIWTDGVSRFLFSLGADANNRFMLYKNNTNNLLTATHVAGGTTKQAIFTFSSVEWFSLALTWNKVADRAKMFVNGVQCGATLTGLGTFAGSFASSFSAIGAFSSAGGGYWSGYEAKIAVWNDELADADVATVGLLAA